MSKFIAVLTVCSVALAAIPASAFTLKSADTAKGKALVDARGMTLYTFDKDSNGKSVCNGPCAQNWPALLASESDAPSGDLTIIIRDDGKRMWAYKGRPLYTFVKDRAPGDITGDGFLNGAWHIARP